MIDTFDPGCEFAASPKAKSEPPAIDWRERALNAEAELRASNARHELPASPLEHGRPAWAVVAALPKCDAAAARVGTCQRRATQVAWLVGSPRVGTLLCDEHAEGMEALPYAAALRALEKLGGGK